MLTRRALLAFVAASVAIALLGLSCGDAEETLPGEEPSTTSTLPGPETTPRATVPPLPSNEPTAFGWGDLLLTIPDRDDVYAQGTFLDPRNPAAGLAVNIIRDENPSDNQFSAVLVDASTGLVVRQEILPADQAVIDEVLANLRVVPLDPTTAPWPYNDPAPETRRTSAGLLSYVVPEPGARIQIYTTLNDPGSSIGLNITNGWATLVVGTDKSGQLLTEFHGDENFRGVFERWLSHARVCTAEGGC